MMTQTQTTPAPDKAARHLPSESPYKGLMPFEPEDRDFFFGRERDTQIITANLKTSRLTVLYGPSGVGKSSVLQAGVLDGLRERARREIEDEDTPSYIGVYFKEWRDAPEAALLAAVRAAIQLTFTDELAPATTLTETLRAWSKQTGAQILLILDQFEEYFLYHPNEDSDGTFAREFVDAVKQPDLRVNFMLSLREDALAQLDRFKGRVPNLFAGIVRINYLDARAARDAIEKPLAQYNKLQDVTGFQKPVTSPVTSVEIEPALVDAVLQQVRVGSVVVGEAGRGTIAGAPASDAIELPYLQVVMTRLWDEERAQGSRVLRYDMLETLGGAQAIVRAHLKRALSNLSPAEEALAAKIFDRLVTPSGSKIAQSPRDLASNAGVSEVEVNALLEQLSGGQYRIVRPVAAAVEEGGEQRYEIFHDVLAGAILDWRAEYVKEQAGLEAERQAAEERRRTRRLRLVVAGVSALALVALLATVFAFNATNEANKANATAQAEATRALVGENKAAVAAKTANAESTRALVGENKAAVAAKTANAESTRALVGENKAAVAAQTANAASTRAIIGEQTAVAAAETAQAESILSQSKSLAAQSISKRTLDLPLAYLLGIEAFKRSDTAEAQSNLFNLRYEEIHRGSFLSGHVAEVYNVAFSPDGKILASGSLDKTIVLWDLAAHKPLGVLTRHDAAVTSLAFSPDGKILASGSLDKTIVLWDVTSRQPLGVLSGHDAAVTSLAFSPDGKTLASGSDDHTIRFWNVETRKSSGALKGHDAAVTSLVFNPNGKSLVSGSFDHTLMLWDVTSRRRLGQFNGHTDIVYGVAFSPDGKTLASGSADHTIGLWDVETLQRLGTFVGHTDAVNSVAFSPDGKTLASGSRDHNIMLWDIIPQQSMSDLPGHAAAVISIAFSPDGTTLASGSADHTIGLWDMTRHRPLGVLESDAEVASVAFSPDGKTLASGNKDNTIWLWDVTSRRPLGVLKGHEAAVASVAFSPDGKTLASGSSDRTVGLWDVVTQKRIGELRGHIDPVYSVVFSPDGKTIASGSLDNTVLLWNVATQQPSGVLKGHEGDVFSLDFSPDGKILASGSADHTIRLWDVETQKSVGILKGHLDAVSRVVFSSDGKTLASGSDDHTIGLWDVDSQERVSTMSVDEFAVYSVTFSPDNKKLASGGAAPTIRVWDVYTPSLLQVVCGIVNRNFTRTEYAQYISREPGAYDTVYAKNPTCEGLPVEPLPTPTPTR